MTAPDRPGVTGHEQRFPARHQWELLVEHGEGSELGFHALWVEDEDEEELARLLGADPGSRVECDLKALAGMDDDPNALGVWMGPHAPGWTHAFVFGMWSFHPAIQNLGKRRVFEIQFTGEAGEGLEPLYLNYDGEQLGDVTPPFEAGGEMMLPDYRPYTVGLELGGKSTHENVHLFFSVMGRVTGRFADREWWTAPRAFYRIPAG
ncbi:hypothetical protein FAF44_26700 [Nonomuraea sp. MG754425]|uniref:hypothetical protein n=1 Tax=Nonomuraea sp. MG754425 TaxID=2570319 RepID=UPI001F1C6345|nr:hypothetical protein [Nonomuraea sp. MG754425]MCF6471954.1 hypothetical protein [Nonomuraea sp. MG754425]